MRSVDDMIKKKVSSITPQSRVLGIGGSPRKGGNSDILLKYMLKGVVEKKGKADSLQLRDFQYQGCIGCEKCRKDKICTGIKDGITIIYPDIIESRGLILVSPTHNYNITSWMKAFIDRLYCFYHFDVNNRPRGWYSRLAGQHRKVILGAICEQENEFDMGFTLDAMRLPLEALGYEIIGELPVFGIFDRAKIKGKDSVLTEATELGAKLAKSL
ncbi:MAG: flavodoxin family protein [Thermodesulfobacteriota bacterium]